MDYKAILALLGSHPELVSKVVGMLLGYFERNPAKLDELIATIIARLAPR